MKKYFFIHLAIALLPLYSLAQTEATLDPEVGGRLSFELDKKIVKGLHISLGEELRFDNNFTAFNRFHTTLNLSYKVNDYFRIGTGYSLINPFDSDSSRFKGSRHRFFLDLIGSVRFGDWRLSVKERVQLTHRAGSFNPFQNTTNLVELKSRLTVKYKGFRKVEPYAYFEIRNTFNAPVVSAFYDSGLGAYFTAAGNSKGEAGWFLSGYDGSYVNRLRGSVGIDWNINKRNTLTFYFMGDYYRDKTIDANAKGTKLKSFAFEKGFMGWLGADYSYSF